jgi:hypothetical protein
MSKLHNDQMLDATNFGSPRTEVDILFTETEMKDKESAIEYGNLKDYIEIFGESDDI